MQANHSLTTLSDIVPSESPRSNAECGELCVSPLWEDVLHGATWHDRCCVQLEEILQDSYWIGAGGNSLLSNGEPVVWLVIIQNTKLKFEHSRLG